MGLNYQFPSLKKIGKLPTIELSEANLANKYAIWFREAEGIPRCVPPLYQDFVIKHRFAFADGEHDFVDIVHYSDDLTQFEVCHVMDGKKILTSATDYADYYDLTVHAEVRIPENSPWDIAWLKNEGFSAVFMVLAVQAFILYHKPDVIPTELPEPKGKKKKSAEQRNTSSAPSKSRVKDSVRRYIRLTAEDEAPVQRNYRAIQWQVRGHYRHLEHADGKLQMDGALPLKN